MNRILTTIFILFSYSISALAQQGVTWGPSGDISTMSFDNMHPRVVMDRSGDPMVIWGKMADKSVYFSRWNGTSFSMPAKINPMGMDIATADWMGPDIASHGDTVYVVVKRTPEAADTNRIFIFSSFNGGTTFNPPVELALIADSVSRFPTVTTDASGNPIVAFMKFNSMFLESRWAVTRSTDFGLTFNTDVKASGWGASADVCDCCPGALVSKGDTSVMLYRDNNNNVRDIWAGISSDNANSFTNGFAVDNNNWMIMSCPSTGPDATILGDTLYSVFMNGGGGTARTYFSKTVLSTSTLITVTGLAANTPGLSLQNFPRIAGDGNAIAIVWRQVINGIAELPIYFTNNISNGFSAAYDSVDLNNITNADVAMRDGKIVVVWQDDNTGTVKYRRGTYTTTTSLPEHHPVAVEIFPNPSGDYINIGSISNAKSIDFQIINSIGEVVYDKNNFSVSSIDISRLSRGIYFLKIISADHTFISKFIKD